MQLRRVSLAVCFLLLVVSGTVAYAQDPSLIALKNAYKRSLDEYRVKEDLFFVASQQYNALKTLAAQEEAVRAAREVMQVRADTMLSYYQALQASLDATPGVELSRKAAFTNQLALFVETIKAHRSRLEIATDRLVIEREANFFESLEPQALLNAYQGLSLLKIGQLQTSLDRLGVVKEQVDNAIANNTSMSETTRTEKERGSAEVARSIQTAMDQLKGTIGQFDKDLSHTDASSFHQIQSKLSVTYGVLTQGVEFLQELAR